MNAPSLQQPQPRDTRRVALSMTPILNLWLIFVSLVTLGYWIGLESAAFNPFRVPWFALVVLGWLWMWAWWAAHNRIRRFDFGWFGSRVLLIVLYGVTAFGSISFMLFHEVGLARAVSPDTKATIVASHIAGVSGIQISVEVASGLRLRRVAQVFRPNDLDWDRDDWPPRSVTLEWTPDSRYVGVFADGHLAAAFERTGATSFERVPTWSLRDVFRSSGPTTDRSITPHTRDMVIDNA